MKPQAPSSADFDPLLQLVGERTGLSFEPPRRANAEVAIVRAMSRAGISDYAQYGKLIGSDPRALDDLIGELTVGETYFFREPQHFALLREIVLPELALRKPERQPIRAWSAGCASGEEAYSLAIACTQAGLTDWTHILATDISRASLAKALRATYGDWSLRGDGAALAGAQLRREGGCYVVDERIRRRVAFEYLNLALDAYPSFATGTWGMDLVFCRNVLIYFDRQTIERVARRLYKCLVPGGWLITASSDPPLAEFAPFEVAETAFGLFLRRPMNTGTLSALPDTQAEPRTILLSPIPTVEDAPVSATPAIAGDTAPVGPADGPEAALARGEYRRAMELARGRLDEPPLAALYVRAAANLDSAEAERLCAEAVSRHPLALELHYLHAVLLLELGRNEEASQAARRVLYLDRSQAIAHFTLGAALQRQGNAEGARLAYRNAQRLCLARPADQTVPLSDGEQAGRLAAAAAAQLALIDATARTTP